jgi:molecular chaperone DnaJ
MNLYEILGLTKNASGEQIRDAYKKLVRKEHPDKGGDAEKFKKIQKAYDILGDDGKRSYYDQTGEVPGDAPEGGGMNMGGMHMGGMPFGMPGMPDIFNMFGQMAGQRNKKRVGKAPPRVTHIPLSLRDYYQGRLFQIQLERNKFCKDCKGEGSTTLKSCAGCNGSGSRKQMIQMGPFIMENHGPCEMCTGSGKQKGDSCWTCKGACFTKEEKKLQVRIEEGMMPGHNVVFSGESSDTPDYTEAGDVVIELQAADENIPWSRKGDDLHASAQITYSESLVGSTVRIGGHPGYEGSVVFPIGPGTINGEHVHFKGYGMPKRGLSVKGDAVLTINVVKPNSTELKSLLQARELLVNLFQVKSNERFDGDHYV